MKNTSISAADGFLIVYNITDIKSFQLVQRYYNDIKRIKNGFPERAGIWKFVITIVGNRCEQEDNRAVATEKGLMLAKELQCGFFETSAQRHRGTDIEGAFHDVIRRFRKSSLLRE